MRIKKRYGNKLQKYYKEILIGNTEIFDLYGKPLSDPLPHSLNDMVEDAISSLEESDQELIRKRFYEKKSLREIAKECNHTNHGRINYALQAAMQKLRDEIISRMEENNVTP